MFIILFFYSCRWSGSHLVAYKEDSILHDIVLAPLCNVPPAPTRSSSEAHSHSLVHDDALVW